MRSPEEAAINGTREIGFAVVSTTIALVAVFTPLAFLKGSTGRLFNEFGVAVAGSVIISGFVALTLTPMLCAKILRVPQRHGRLYRILEEGFNRLASGYSRSLASRCVGASSSLAVAALVTAGAVLVFRSLKREFVPSGGPRMVPDVHHCPGRFIAGLYRQLPAPRRGRFSARQRRSAASSAWSTSGTASVEGSYSPTCKTGPNVNGPSRR